MRIGIFSKFEMSGGSEHRAIEIANAICKYTKHQAVLLVERGNLKSELKARVNGPLVESDVMAQNINAFYECDRLLIVNTDSKYFTTVDYWEGKSDRHRSFVELGRVNNMTFLFNFIISPARHLSDLSKKCKEVLLLPTNQRFFDEIDKKDKHINIRHLPRMVFESPIDPSTIPQYKFTSDQITIGKHSGSLGSKWNSEHRELILRLNGKYGNRILWDFMGAGEKFAATLRDIPNVIMREGFSMPVSSYLPNINIYLFYPSWDRQEPWSRAVAEGLMSGCPVVATDTDGGNRMQIVHGNNGFLCKSIDDFEHYLARLIDDELLIKRLGDNAMRYARFFTSEYLIYKLMTFWGI